VTEDPTLEVPEPHNRPGTWQGAFRTGHFDAAARHPLRVCRSYLVAGQPYRRIIPGPERDLRHQERVTRMLLAARPVHEPPGPDWPGLVEDVLGAPVVLRSFGPAAADKRAVAPVPRP
jgi:adenylosuccinate synthase